MTEQSKNNPQIENQVFRSLLNLMMCSDPWPAAPEDDDVLLKFCNEESQRHGYDTWIDAYHQFR